MRLRATGVPYRRIAMESGMSLAGVQRVVRRATEKVAAFPPEDDDDDSADAFTYPYEPSAEEEAAYREELLAQLYLPDGSLNRLTCYRLLFEMDDTAYRELRAKVGCDAGVSMSAEQECVILVGRSRRAQPDPRVVEIAGCIGGPVDRLLPPGPYDTAVTFRCRLALGAATAHCGLFAV